MKDIFDKCKLEKLNLNSRIIRTGLWESQDLKNGKLTKEVYDRYELLASSGIGLITTELLSLYPRNKFSDLSHKTYTPNFIADFKKITDITHKYNTPILGQLMFVQYNRGIDLNINVNDLKIDDIRRIQVDFITAAKKLSYAGFDGIQIAMGNNFYLSKFINPYFNQRTDSYGKDTYGRMRIILEIIKVIKDNTDLHINCRVNAYDGRKGGIDIKESIEICKLLEEYGADSLQITKPLSPLYFTKECENNELVDYVSLLKKDVNLPVIIGGGLHNKKQINKLLNDNDVDFFSMFRPFVAQPDLLTEWKNNKTDECKCMMCNNCYRRKSSSCYHFNK